MLGVGQPARTLPDATAKKILDAGLRRHDGNLDAVIAEQGFTGLPISLRHGQEAGALPGPHRDPFDRVLIAQALLEGIVLVSNEHAFDACGAGRLW